MNRPVASKRYQQLMACVLAAAVLALAMQLPRYLRPQVTSAGSPEKSHLATPRPDPYAIRLGRVAFAATPLDQVLREIGRRADVPIMADWSDTPTTPDPLLEANPVVSLSIDEATLADVLDALCTQLHITYSQHDAAIELRPPAPDYSICAPSEVEVVDVAPLLGPPVAFRARSVDQIFMDRAAQDSDLRYRASRHESRGLAEFIQKVHGCRIVPLGTRLVIRGNAHQLHAVDQTLEDMRHPIRPAHATATRKASTDANKIIPPPSPLTGWEDEANYEPALVLETWRKASRGMGRIEISNTKLSWRTDVAVFGEKMKTLLDVAALIVAKLDIPASVIPAGEEDEFIHIRELHCEEQPRVYDISAIDLQRPGWSLSQDPDATKAEALENIFYSTVEFHGRSSMDGGYYATWTCWGDFVAVREAPETHRHLLAYLQQQPFREDARDTPAH
jgi:hypothetical protein